MNESHRLIHLPVHPDDRGKLGVIEGSLTIPFDVRRVYYLYDVPADSDRGGHAHRDLQQLLIAVSGSFDVLIDDGVGSRTYQLHNPSEGVLLGSMVWRELRRFSSNAVCLVLASHRYDESDYIRDFEQFRREVASG